MVKFMFESSCLYCSQLALLNCFLGQIGICIRPSPRGGGGTGSSLRTRSPPFFFDSWDPKCAKKIGGPFQSGSFSAVSTINVKISSFFGIKNCIRSWC